MLFSVEFTGNELKVIDFNVINEEICSFSLFSR